MSETWSPLAPLREVSEFVRDGTHASFQRVSRGKPLLSAKNITEAGDVVWDSSDSLVSDADYRAISRSFQITRGDVLLTIVGSIGRVAPFKSDDEVVFQRSVAVIRPRRDLIERDFLVHALRARTVQSDLIRRANATAQAGLYLGELERVLIPVPPLADQRRIAEALDSVDAAIRSTERLIAKVEQANQGLLRDLLTRGINESGQLRDPQHHPEQFALTRAGLRPCGWRICTIHEIVVNRDGRRIPLKQEDRARRRGSFPYYGASGIIDYIDDYLFDGSYILLGEDGENVVSRNVPLAFIARGRFWVNNHAHVLEPRAGNNIEFLAALFESTDFGRLVNVSAQPKLTQSALDSLLFAVPGIEEQERISHRIMTRSRQLDAYQRELAKLRLLKQGLAEDLLTGQVRVEAAA